MTISPKDLRIDNLLYQKNTALVAKASSINQSGFTCRDEFGVAIKNGLFEPITLTEQWLVRLGFEYRESTGEYELKDEEGFTIFEVKKWAHNGLFYISDEGCITHEPLNYVHELQNAVHALTKKDLL